MLKPTAFHNMVIFLHPRKKCLWKKSYFLIQNVTLNLQLLKSFMYPIEFTYIFWKRLQSPQISYWPFLDFNIRTINSLSIWRVIHSWLKSQNNYSRCSRLYGCAIMRDLRHWTVAEQNIICNIHDSKDTIVEEYT